MKESRRKHSPAFKAKVELEALKEEESTAEIASRFEVHPAQVRTWKRSLMEGASGIFGGVQGRQKDDESLIAQLYQQIGSLSVERRRAMVERQRPSLSVARQCRALGISRSSLYYQPVGVSQEVLELMKLLDKQYTWRGRSSDPGGWLYGCVGRATASIGSEWAVSWERWG